MSRALVLLALAVGACAPSWKKAPHDRIFQDAPPPRLHPAPASYVPSQWWDVALHAGVWPIARALSPARYLLAVAGGRRALDVNAFGQVPDSPWFVNRIGRRGMTPEAVRRGANGAGGPAAGELAVTDGTIEGATPRLVVRDRAGVEWLVKFDSPAFPEMMTGAEMIVSRLMHAAGYWVAETYLVELELTRLRLAESGREQAGDDLTEAELDILIANLNPGPNGRQRALFRRVVPGRPLGPFSFRGLRADDPNDDIRHERRRSLRGLWVLCAWTNHTGARADNTLDTFIPVTGSGDGYVRHYLLDFDESLGAGGDRDKHAGEGHEYLLDWSAMLDRALGLGLRYPAWDDLRRAPYRSVGYFEAEFFEPRHWRPRVPNPAFLEAQFEDTFWAAAILSRFSDEHIAAAVDTARYSEDGAADYVTRVLIERRDKLLRHAFAPVLALGDPRIRDGYEVRLTDLEVAAGLVADHGGYRWAVRWNRTGGRDRMLDAGTSARPRFDLRDAVRSVMTRWRSGFRSDPYLTLTIAGAGSGAGPAIDLHLRVVRDRLLPVALERR